MLCEDKAGASRWLWLEHRADSLKLLEAQASRPVDLWAAPAARNSRHIRFPVSKFLPAGGLFPPYSPFYSKLQFYDFGTSLDVSDFHRKNSTPTQVSDLRRGVRASRRHRDHTVHEPRRLIFVTSIHRPT
jgi:hypothetical protein